MLSGNFRYRHRFTDRYAVRDRFDWHWSATEPAHVFLSAMTTDARDVQSWDPDGVFEPV